MVEVHTEVAAMKISVAILSQSVRPRKMWIKNVKMLKYDKRCQLLIVLKKAARKDMCDTKYLLVSCKMLMKKGIEIDHFIIWGILVRMVMHLFWGEKYKDLWFYTLFYIFILYLYSS